MPFVQRENNTIVGLFNLPQPDIPEEFLPDDDADVISYRNPVLNPLAQITEAVKALPVEKRTNAQWGLFISQCLLAIQNADSEALAYLVNGFETQDADYLDILAAARQLFGIGGG